MAARSSTSALTGSGSSATEALEAALVAVGHAHLVARLDELAGHVAAYEPRPAGDADPHASSHELPIDRNNFPALRVFLHSYTGSRP